MLQKNDKVLQDLEGFLQNLSAEDVEKCRKFLNRRGRNPFVYGVVKKTSYASLVVEAFYEYFTYFYTKKAIETLGGLAKLSDDIISPLAIASALTLVVLDTGANLTLFDPETISNSWSRNFFDGFFKGTYRNLKKIIKSNGFCNSFIVIAIPTLGALVAYPVGAYANVESIEPWLSENMGQLKWIVMGPVIVIGSTYYVLSQFEDALTGMNFLLNQGNERLEPPQSTLLYKIFWQRDIPTALQCLIEQFSAAISRAIGFGYLAGRIAEESQLSSDWVVTFQIIGFSATVLAFHPARAPSTYKKYYGTKNRRLDLITDEIRNKAYLKKYADMNFLKFMLHKILQLLHPIGLVESGLVAYFTTHVQNYLKDVDSLKTWNGDLVITFLCSFITSGLILLIHYKAISKKELNEFAIEHLVNGDKVLPLNASLREDTVSPISKLIGAAFSLGTWSTRTLNGIPFMMGLIKSMPIKDQVVFAIGNNIIPAVNGYDYYYGKVSDTVDKIGKRVGNVCWNCCSGFTFFKKSPEEIQKTSFTNTEKNESSPLLPEITSNPDTAYELKNG